MTLIAVLKFLHYLGLFLAGGAGVANGLLAANHLKAGMPPAAPVQKSMMTMIRLGLGALVLLWLTGFALAFQIYGGMNLGWAFYVKLLGATGLLGILLVLNLHLSGAAKMGTPPNARLMQLAPMIARGSLVLVLGGIAITTSL